MAEEAPEHQDRGMFGLFGKKKEDEGKQSDHIVQTPAQTEAASYYPAAPPYGAEHGQGHGYEGQFTPEEAEQQKHTGKLHRTHSSSSSSSSDEEEEGGKKKEGGRKKKGSKEKTKEKLPGAGKQYSGEDGKQYSGQHGGEEEKKTGMFDKIKEKLPGHHNKNDGEQ
uniref:Late embryogenesis abundant protein LEA8-2 n=1 Tax=Pinus tabuliformis TaxID=88731 RepID=A0A0A7REH0_PINTB|nr:late embryogenesis abundant protein LEA8-2 [Pinus tabuliformis]